MDAVNTLVVTVGGSPQPVVSAVVQLRPRFVVFVCTGGTGPAASRNQVDGEGSPCEIRSPNGETRRLPNLLTQIADEGLHVEHRLVLIDEPDDPDEVFAALGSLFVKEQLPDPVGVDYTGGTKSMSVGAALWARATDRPTLITTARRRDVDRVAGGEVTRRQAFSRIRRDEVLRRRVPDHLERFDFGAAAASVMPLLRSDPDAADLAEIVAALRGFDAWDRVDLPEARTQLEASTRDARSWLGQLSSVESSLRVAAGESPARKAGPRTFAAVADLLLNAERCSKRRRYDDAVARLYRALELLAQLLLRDSGIDTSAVPHHELASAVEAGVAHSDDEGRRKIGLVEAWDLLERRGDPAGRRFGAKRQQLFGALETRNRSLLAHGMTPVSLSDYARFDESVGRFLRDELTALGAWPMAQLPAALRLGADEVGVPPPDQ